MLLRSSKTLSDNRMSRRACEKLGRAVRCQHVVLTLITKPLATIEPELCKMLDVESLIPVAEAGDDDLFMLETSEGWTVLEGSQSLVFSAAFPECADRLVALSAAAGSQIRSITVQTNSGFVHIFVAESGRMLRRFEIGEEVPTDEGTLPAWDEQISRDPEGAPNY